MQAVHQAALEEFGRGLRTLAGEADLQVVGPCGGFDERLFETLAARPEVAAATPLLVLDVRRRAVRPDAVDAEVNRAPAALSVYGVDGFTLPAVTPQLLPRPMPGTDRLAPLAEHNVFLSAAAQRALAKIGVLEISRPGEIRAMSLAVFDRTFAVTYLPEAVAVAIGLAGVAASFAALAEGGAVRSLPPSHVRFEPLAEWRSPRTSITYPVGWRLTIARRVFEVRALMPDHELESRRSTGAIYGESAVRLSEVGTEIGRGYLEMTDYG